MPDKTQGGRESFRLLYPPHKPARGTPVPDSSFFHTLQIDQMVSVRRESWRGLPDLRLEQFYTTDTDVLAWRLDVVADLVESEALRGLIRDALPLLRDAAEMRKVLNSSSSTVESSLASVRYLELYLELVELFHARLADAPIRSAGFAALRDEVEARRQSADYRALTAQLEKTQYQIGHVKSIALGVNLDGTLRVTEVGLLALNTEKYRQGSVLDKLLGRDKSDPMVCISGFANLAKTAREEEKHALDQAVCRALDNAFAKTIRSWEPVIDQYFRDETSFFIGLLDDFRFLSAASAFLLELRGRGCALCRPAIRPMEDKALRLQDVYNPMLVLRSEGQAVVANDFTYDDRGRFYLVTGPNHGGKSIFCYSVGMAQALFQLGLLVPARAAVMSPVRCIFTHFPASDEDNYGKGRLESECARMSQILTQLQGDDLLLMELQLHQPPGGQLHRRGGAVGHCGDRLRRGVRHPHPRADPAGGPVQRRPRPHRLHRQPGGPDGKRGRRHPQLPGAAHHPGRPELRPGHRPQIRPELRGDPGRPRHPPRAAGRRGSKKSRLSGRRTGGKQAGDQKVLG